MKTLWADPEYRARQRRSRKKAWKTRDREAQAKIMAKIWTPSKRRRHSAMMKKAQRKRIKSGLRNPRTAKAKHILSNELKRLWR